MVNNDFIFKLRGDAHTVFAFLLLCMFFLEKKNIAHIKALFPLTNSGIARKTDAYLAIIMQK